MVSSIVSPQLSKIKKAPLELSNKSIEDKKMRKLIVIIMCLVPFLYGQSQLNYSVSSINYKIHQSNYNQNVTLEEFKYQNNNPFSIFTKASAVNYNNYILEQNKKKKKDNTVIAGVLGFVAGGLVYEAILNGGEGSKNVSSEYPDAEIHDSGSIGQHIAGWVLLGGLGALFAILITS